jgi:glutathione S-transferase
MTPYPLIGMTISPWSHKALWALDVCGVPYTFKQYLPPFHELLLRLRTGRFRGPISVPVLLGPEGAIWGASDIAAFANQYAAKQTGKAQLGDLQAAAVWSELSDEALAEGRARVMRDSLADAESLDDYMPFIPAAMRKSMRWLVRDTLQKVDDKYAHLVVPGAIARALAKTREQLSTSGGQYLLGQFSYADIAMAAVLEGVEPLKTRRVQRSPKSRALWTVPDLATEYRDLLAWRARLLEATRPAFLTS